MNIVICDDIRSETAKLSRLLQESGFQLTVSQFHHGRDVLDFIRSGAIVELCFLDILMPELGGIALAEALRKEGYAGEIVFLTTSNEYAAESYRVQAFSYILKPPSPQDVRQVLQRYEELKRVRDTEGIFLKMSRTTKFVLYRNISYVEVIRHYVHFHLTDGETIKIYTTFADIAAQLLTDRRFAQCHRSYIVNMSEMAFIDERDIAMNDGSKIPHSRSYADIKKRFTKWMLGGSGR